MALAAFFYEGEGRGDERSGYGRMTYADGSVYEGRWRHDKRDGKGKLTRPDGSAVEGEWKDDAPVTPE